MNSAVVVLLSYWRRSTTVLRPLTSSIQFDAALHLHSREGATVNDHSTDKDTPEPLLI